MGFENIREANGVGIAVTGMTIVFIALSLIALFIAMLPKILQVLSFPPPPSDPHLHALFQARSTNDEEIAVAVGFALHQREMKKPQKS